MMEPEALTGYLQQQYGAEGVMVRDQENNSWMRPWGQEDSLELCRRLEQQEEHRAETEPNTCRNLEQTATLLGIGTQTLQVWLRRKDNPLPHIRDGRRIIIADFLLTEWIRAESERNTAGTGRQRQDG